MRGNCFCVATVTVSVLSRELKSDILKKVSIIKRHTGSCLALLYLDGIAVEILMLIKEGNSSYLDVGKMVMQ